MAAIPTAVQPASRALRFRSDRGMVTAEAALVLPLLAAFAMAMVYLVSIALTKVTVVDAARDAARAIARGDLSAHAVAQARATAPDGAMVTVTRQGDEVSVHVSAEAGAPRWLVVPLPGVRVESEATVAVEETDGLR